MRSCVYTARSPYLFNFSLPHRKLVRPDLVGRLALAEEAQCTVRREHDLWRLGIGVVVERGHRRAVGARPADDD